MSPFKYAKTYTEEGILIRVGSTDNNRMPKWVRSEKGESYSNFPFVFNYPMPLNS